MPPVYVCSLLFTPLIYAHYYVDAAARLRLYAIRLLTRLPILTAPPDYFRYADVIFICRH